MKYSTLVDQFRARSKQIFGKNYRLWPPNNKIRPGVFYETPNEYHKIYEEGLRKTQMKDNPARRLRFFAIRQAIRNTLEVPGDAIEAGCYRGLSAWLAATALQGYGRELTFHICDSFEGLSEPQASDVPTYKNKKAGRHKFICDESQVMENLSEFNFIEYHKGWIPSPFNSLQDCKFCYAHIDVDLYEPTRDSIGFIWPRMNHGAILLLDDYGTTNFPGARRAIDEFFATQTNFVFFEQPSGQALAIKL
jgi:O-methyltransferase